MKIRQKIIVLIITLILILGIGLEARATSKDPEKGASFSITNVINSVKEFNKRGKGQDGTVNDSQEIGKNFAKELKPVGEFLILLGTAVSIGITIIFGIQYALASSNTQEVAKLKEKLTGFLIASFVFFSAYPIWIFVLGLVENATTSIN